MTALRINCLCDVAILVYLALSTVGCGLWAGQNNRRTNRSAERTRAAQPCKGRAAREAIWRHERVRGILSGRMLTAVVPVAFPLI